VAALLGADELVTPQPGAGAPSAAQQRVGVASIATAAPLPPKDLFATQFGILRYASPEAAEAAVRAFESNQLPPQVYDSVATMSVSLPMRPLDIPDPECAPSGSCRAMWGMDLLRVAEVWKRLSVVPAAGDAAFARTALIADAGVSFDHSDFAVPGGTYLARDQSVTFNAARYPMSSTPGNDDGNGHGTHVASIVGAGWGNADDRGIAGVVGRARLLSCRFLADYTPEDYGGTGADAVRCINHGTTTKSFVINASFGGGLSAADFLAMRQAVADYCASGGVLVAAAGNEGIELGVRGVSYPAQFAGQPGMECVLAVGAVARNASLTWWSNWGMRVAVAAPGHQIAADWIPNAGILTPGSPTLAGTNRAWTTISGTSMAAPHVTGVVLLLGNAFPAASAADVVACVKATAARTPSSSPVNGAQYVVGGIVDADAAYRCLETRVGGGSGSSVTCSAERAVVRLRRTTTGCAGLASPPGSTFFASAAAEASLSFSPAGPYPPGDHDVSVLDPSTGHSCVAKFTVQGCNIECGGPFEVYQQQKDGSCPSTLPLPANAVWAPPGVSVSLSPSGPYPVGTTLITATPSDPTLSLCTVSYKINPCRLRCGSPVTGSLKQGARCLDAAPFPKNGVVAPEGVSVTLRPPGPFPQGNHTVTASPSNGTPSCTVRLVMPACVPTPTNCSAAPVAADLASASPARCPSPGTLAALPAGAVAVPTGVAVALSPAGPWRPGKYAVVATPDNGAPACTVDLTVVGCDGGGGGGGEAPPPPSPSPPPPPDGPDVGPLACRAEVTRALTPAGGCDGAALAPADLLTSAPAQETLSASPSGPYPPGATTVVRVSSSSSSCDARVTVTPCRPECADATTKADPGQCSAAALPAAFVVAGSVASSANAATIVPSPAAPFPVGRTQVSVVARYGSTVSSAASARCALTVVDDQPPLAPDTQTCLYPAAGRSTSYTPSSKCFGLAELVAASDNCAGAGGVTLKALDCVNVSPASNSARACRVATGGGSVCVSLRNLPTGAATARVVRARVQATDASGNSAVAVAQISVYRRRGEDATCLSISRANAQVGRTPVMQLRGGEGEGGGTVAPSPSPTPIVRRRGIAVRRIGGDEA
jgi:hypothetical protein